MDLGVNLRVLPAGAERDRLGNQDLPLRELTIDRDGRSLTVFIGPTEPGGPERELYEVEIAI